jgi:hypothetical protein
MRIARRDLSANRITRVPRFSLHASTLRRTGSAVLCGRAPRAPTQDRGVASLSPARGCGGRNMAGNPSVCTFDAADPVFPFACFCASDLGSYDVRAGCLRWPASGRRLIAAAGV